MKRNKMATQTPAEKHNAYWRDVVMGAVAYGRDGVTHPLITTPIRDVEFIGGLWRIQVPFEHDIVDVRGRQFVLGRKLDVQEKNKFEYFDAYSVGCNCYGPFVDIERPDYIVGRFSGAKNTFWAYGTTIPVVRSFLAIALFDQYSDMIFKKEKISHTK